MSDRNSEHMIQALMTWHFIGFCCFIGISLLPPACPDALDPPWQFVTSIHTRCIIIIPGVRYTIYNTRCTIQRLRYTQISNKLPSPCSRGPHHHKSEPSMQITPSDYLDGLLIVHYYVDPLLIDISALINREPFIYLHGTPFTDRPSLVLSSPSCSFLRALIILYYFSSISLSAQNWVVMKWYVKFLCQKYHASNFLGISGCFPVNSYHGKLGFPGQKAQQNICPQKKLLTNEKNKQSMFRAAISYFAISGQWQV